MTTSSGESMTAMSAAAPFAEDDDGLISNGAGVDVEVLGPDLIRVTVCGSAVELPAEPGKAADGAISWLIDAREATRWTGGTCAGAPIAGPERTALLDCLRRALTAVGEHVTVQV